MNATRIYAGLGLVFAILLFPETSLAFRCGNKLITEGMQRLEVLARCGLPAEESTEHVLSQPYYTIRNKQRRYTRDEHGRYVTRGNGPWQKEIVRQRLIYNFGPNRLMRELRFEDGQLVAIKALGYGFRN